MPYITQQVCTTYTTNTPTTRLVKELRPFHMAPAPSRPASQPQAPPFARRPARRSGRSRSREGRHAPPPPPRGNERSARRGQPAAPHAPAALDQSPQDSLPRAASGSCGTRRKWARRAVPGKRSFPRGHGLSPCHWRVDTSSSCAVLPVCPAGFGRRGCGSGRGSRLGLRELGASPGHRWDDGRRLQPSRPSAPGAQPPSPGRIGERGGDLRGASLVAPPKPTVLEALSRCEVVSQ